jgi:hypothetical protein
MQQPRRWLNSWRLFVLACLLATSIAHENAAAADQPRRSIVPMLAEQLGLSEQQVRGALGALLVFVREELPKPEFDELAKTIPNADRIMQDVKQSGIVTRPLDDVSEFEESLSMLGIGQPLASQFAPAVLHALGAAGHDRERDILARALN